MLLIEFLLWFNLLWDDNMEVLSLYVKMGFFSILFGEIWLRNLRVEC